MKHLLFISFVVLFFSCSPNQNHAATTGNSLFRPDMIPLQGGEFMMGDSERAGDPSAFSYYHKVILSPFDIAETEVTRKQYASLIKKMNPDKRKIEKTNVDSLLQKPVGVTWIEAARYCNALSRIEGRTPCYNTITWHCNFKADGYRLPTEAEWEYACRAGTTGQYFWIPDTAKDRTFYADTALLYAWFADTSKVRRYQPVRQLRPNGFGLYDMIGNVEEWCNDLWDPWYYQRSPVNNPKGSSYLFNWDLWLQLGGRMVRGADNHNNSSGLASYYRPSVSYDPEYDKAGIRLVLNRPVPDRK